MAPVLIPEQLIHSFKVVGLNRRISELMRSRGKLYCCTASFSVEHKDQAYALNNELANDASQVVITRSKDGYKVWKELFVSPVSS